MIYVFWCGRTERPLSAVRRHGWSALNTAQRLFFPRARCCFYLISLLLLSHHISSIARWWESSIKQPTEGDVQSRSKHTSPYSNSRKLSTFNMTFSCNIFFLSVQILLNRTGTKPQNKAIQLAVLCILQAPGSSLIPDTCCLNRRCRGVPQCRLIISWVMP